jgi:hypothetical protein
VQLLRCVGREIDRLEELPMPGVPPVEAALGE